MSQPDVYLIILDEHARGDVMESTFHVDQGHFNEALSRLGLSLAEQATANYSMTYASIPSLLDGTYLMEAGDRLTPTQELNLYLMAAGSNQSVAWFRSRGYRYVHFEGSLSTQCGRQVDDCRRFPTYDETMSVLWSQTPIGGVIDRLLGPFPTKGALDQLDGLQQLASTEREVPRFVFAHVLLPHAPLYLDERCRIRVAKELGGRTVSGPMHEDAMPARLKAYSEQVECVDAKVIGIIEALPPTSVVVIVSDHGPTTTGQLWITRDRWTADQIEERLSVLAAARLPRDCPKLPEDVSLVNVMRIVTACLDDQQIQQLPERRYLVPWGTKDPSGAVRVPSSSEIGRLPYP